MIKMEPKEAARSILASKPIDIITRPSDKYKLKEGIAIIFIAADENQTVFMCDSANDIRSVFDRKLPVREWRSLNLLDGIVFMYNALDRAKRGILPKEVWIIKDKRSKILGGAKGESVLIFSTDDLAKAFIEAKGYDATSEKMTRTELLFLAQIYDIDIYHDIAPRHPMKLDFFN